MNSFDSNGFGGQRDFRGNYFDNANQTAAADARSWMELARMGEQLCRPKFQKILGPDTRNQRPGIVNGRRFLNGGNEASNRYNNNNNNQSHYKSSNDQWPAKQNRSEVTPVSLWSRRPSGFMSNSMSVGNLPPRMLRQLSATQTNGSPSENGFGPNFEHGSLNERVKSIGNFSIHDPDRDGIKRGSGDTHNSGVGSVNSRVSTPDLFEVSPIFGYRNHTLDTVVNYCFHPHSMDIP